MDGSSRARALVMLLGVALALAGCGARRAAPLVGHRVAAALDCPAEEVEVRHRGGGAWEAHGCGRTETFVCRREPWLGLRCHPRGEPS